MRSFDDDRGQHWQAAVMEASFGNTLMIFSRIGAADVLHAPMQTDTLRAAEDALADADEARVRALLAAATPWP